MNFDNGKIYEKRTWSEYSNLAIAPEIKSFTEAEKFLKENYENSEGGVFERRYNESDKGRISAYLWSKCKKYVCSASGHSVNESIKKLVAHLEEEAFLSLGAFKKKEV